MKIYEYTSQEVNEVIPFRNETFGQISQEHWEAMNCTAVVARQDDRLVGFIPLQYREQCLNPQVTIPVVYENAVGVAQDMRGQGIGTAMIEKAARFISDRADALMVIRGGEQSIGYRFYRKTGHSDLVYARRYTLPPETRLPLGHTQEIRVLDRQAWAALEPQLLALYQTQYGRFGGGQQRKPGYWTLILAKKNGHHDTP